MQSSEDRPDIVVGQKNEFVTIVSQLIDGDKSTKRSSKELVENVLINLDGDAR